MQSSLCCVTAPLSPRAVSLPQAPPRPAVLNPRYEALSSLLLLLLAPAAALATSLPPNARWPPDEAQGNAGRPPTCRAGVAVPLPYRHRTGWFVAPPPPHAAAAASPWALGDLTSITCAVPTSTHSGGTLHNTTGAVNRSANQNVPIRRCGASVALVRYINRRCGVLPVTWPRLRQREAARWTPDLREDRNPVCVTPDREGRGEEGKG